MITEDSLLRGMNMEHEYESKHLWEYYEEDEECEERREVRGNKLLVKFLNKQV